MGGKVMFGREEKEVLEQADDLVNKHRDFNQAFGCLASFVARNGADGDTHRASAEVWFKLASISLLLDDDFFADLHAANGRRAPGYNSVMEGDFMRDRVLNLVRRGELTEARKQFAELKASRYHAGDRNREALMHMTLGRICFEEGLYRQAEAQLHRAFHTLPAVDRNPQWQHDIQFHWLMAAATYGKRRHRIKRWYADYIREETSRKRRIAARIMYWLGRPGAWVVRRLGQ